MTRRIVTAREQRELLSPWMIEAVEDDDRKRKPVVGEDDSKTTTETSEKDWSGDDSKPHAPGAVISQNPYAPDPFAAVVAEPTTRPNSLLVVEVPAEVAVRATVLIQPAGPVVDRPVPA